MVVFELRNDICRFFFFETLKEHVFTSIMHIPIDNLSVDKHMFINQQYFGMCSNDIVWGYIQKVCTHI